MKNEEICVFMADPYYVGGAEIYALRYLNKIKNIIKNNILIIAKNGIYVLHKDNTNPIKLASIPFYEITAPIRIIKKKCNLFIAATYNSWIPALISGIIKQKPVILHIFDLLSDPEHGGIAFKKLLFPEKISNIARERIIVQNLVKAIGKENSTIITLSPCSSRAIERVLNIKPIVIPPFLNVSELQLKYGCRPLEARDIDIIYIGRLVKHKNLDKLILSINMLSRKLNMKVKVTIAGDGPELIKLKKLAVNLGVEKYIEFTGRISEEEKYAALSRSKVFVSTSVMEGFGITTLEAMSLGSVPITSNICTSRWLVADSGFIFNPLDPHDLANTLYNVLHNLELLKIKELKACRRARDFDESVLVEKYATLVELLLG